VHLARPYLKRLSVEQKLGVVWPAERESVYRWRAIPHVRLDQQAHRAAHYHSFPHRSGFRLIRPATGFCIGPDAGQARTSTSWSSSSSFSWGSGVTTSSWQLRFALARKSEPAPCSHADACLQLETSQGPSPDYRSFTVTLISRPRSGPGMITTASVNAVAGFPSTLTASMGRPPALRG